VINLHTGLLDFTVAYRRVRILSLMGGVVARIWSICAFDQMHSTTEQFIICTVFDQLVMVMVIVNLYSAIM